jgi:hypothetical protein
MTMSEGIQAGLAILIAGSGGIIWIVGAMIAPVKKAVEGSEKTMKVVIDNNTRAMEKLVALVDQHEDRLDDHHDRIARIETIHDVRGCHVVPHNRRQDD